MAIVEPCRVNNDIDVDIDSSLHFNEHIEHIVIV